MTGRSPGSRASVAATRHRRRQGHLRRRSHGGLRVSHGPRSACHSRRVQIQPPGAARDPAGPCRRSPGGEKRRGTRRLQRPCRRALPSSGALVSGRTLSQRSVLRLTLLRRRAGRKMGFYKTMVRDTSSGRAVWRRSQRCRAASQPPPQPLPLRGPGPGPVAQAIRTPPAAGANRSRTGPMTQPSACPAGSDRRQPCGGSIRCRRNGSVLVRSRLRAAPASPQPPPGPCPAPAAAVEPAPPAQAPRALIRIAAPWGGPHSRHRHGEPPPLT